MSRNVRLWAIIVLIALVVIFIFQNIAEVEIQLFFWTITTRRAFMVFLLLVIGALIGWFGRGIYMRRHEEDAGAGQAVDRPRHD